MPCQAVTLYLALVLGSWLSLRTQFQSLLLALALNVVLAKAYSDLKQIFPGLFTDTFELICFHFSVFFLLFSCWFRAVD